MADSEQPGSDNPIRVFLLDDHEVVRRGVQAAVIATQVQDRQRREGR